MMKIMIYDIIEEIEELKQSLNFSEEELRP